MNQIDQSIFSNESPFIGVKVLLYVDSTHAVFEQRDGKGTFPFQIDLIGGGREGNESPLETTIREVFEETGVIVNVSNIIHATTHPSIHDHSQIAYFLVLEVNSTLETLRMGNEGLGLVILDPYVFIDLDNAVPVQQERVRNYLGGLAV